MMAAVIDTRFLKVHPATARWWEQRKQCRKCVHHSQPVPTTAAMYRGELCKASPWPHRGRYKKQYEPCIDARATADERDDGRAGLCGPDAVLWEPKEPSNE